MAGVDEKSIGETGVTSGEVGVGSPSQELQLFLSFVSERYKLLHPSHSHHPAESKNGPPKERKWFQTGNRDLESWGVRVYTYPPEFRHGSSWEKIPVPLETHA